MSENKTMVEMTEEQKAQFEAFQQEQQRKAVMERKKQQREELQGLTDEVMEDAVARLQKCSEMLKECKNEIMDTFRALIEMRREVNSEAGKKEQDSYTFTDSKGNNRIRIGYNMLDNYTDNVEEGIAKVKGYIGSLAKDDDSKALVDTVLRLLSKDEAGNLKASRVMQLWKMAQDSKNAEFIEGMRIIQESYRPIRSKLFIRCSVKRADCQDGEWMDIPLGLTEV